MVFKFQTDLANKIRLRNYPILRESLGEFVGTAIMMAYGCGVLCQTYLGDGGGKDHGTFISISMGWGLAVFMGVFYAGKAGKGHINPAVTVAMAVTGKFEWARVPAYLAAQHLGAFAGSLAVFAVYQEKIYHHAMLFDNGTLIVETTGNVFVSNAHGVSTASCFFDLTFSTALLTGGVYAIIDRRNFNVPEWAHPLCVFFMVIGVVGSYALNAGAPLNPARDFGPRLMILMCGWGSKSFSTNNYYGCWVPILGPHLGAIIGAALYELTVGIHLPGESQCAAALLPATSQPYESQNNKENNHEVEDGDMQLKSLTADA